MARRDERGWLNFSLAEELRLLREQGYDPELFRPEFEVIAALPAERSAEAVERLKALYDRIQADPGPRAPDYPYNEPSVLAEIRAERPEGPRRLERAVSDEQLHDRLLGAWQGRIAGCMLGKPIEGWPFEKIKALGEYIGEWPLAGYIPDRTDPPEDLKWAFRDKSLLRGHITHGVRDDDTDYTILGLKILEQYGPGFTSDDVAEAWLHSFPLGYVYTAEHAAYMNLVNYIYPPRSAFFRNGFREWIGAQIRADGWGYCAPGWPELAAEFAHRDAAVSHVKNGIYGEMFFAAAISAALVSDDLNEVLDVALSEIPRSCRLAEAIRDTIGIASRHADWESAWHDVAGKYNHYHCVHTINNAVFVVLGLLFSGGDYEKAITLAVMGGEDVDCTGATAGSVMGALLGARALPAKWIAPLNDRLDSCVMGFASNSIAALAARTLAMSKRVISGEGHVTPGSEERPPWE